MYATATLGTSLSFNHSAAWASISARPSFLGATAPAVDCAFSCPAARIMLTHPSTATTKAFLAAQVSSLIISPIQPACLPLIYALSLPNVPYGNPSSGPLFDDSGRLSTDI